MKLRSLLLLLFISVFISNGLTQHAIYQTSFESGQDQWTAPAVGENHWELKSGSQSHSGQMYWAINEGKSYSHDENFIISGEFVLNAGYDHYFLTLWANPEMRRCDSPMPGLLDEQYEVYIRDVNAKGDFQVLFYDYDRDYPADSKGWEFVDKDHIPASGTCELKPWEGKTVQLKISMQTDAQDEPQGHGLYIDDLKILGTNSPTYPIELYHDDGTAESATHLWYDYISLAVKFNTYWGKGSKKVIGFRFYITEEPKRENLNFRIWDDDGPDGYPGTVLLSFTLEDQYTLTGWNEVIIGPSYQVDLDEGYFYLGFEGPYTTRGFGVDESSGGMSVRFVEGDWYDEDYSYMVRALVQETVGIDDENETKPGAIVKMSPNPFIDQVSVEYLIAPGSTQKVELSVYDINGRKITTLVNESQSSGEYRVEWNAAGYPAGIYFCMVTIGNFSEMTKVIKLQ